MDNFSDSIHELFTYYPMHSGAFADTGIFRWTSTAFQRRLELIQHFDFPTAASRIKVSPDQSFMIASGTVLLDHFAACQRKNEKCSLRSLAVGMYPPQMRTYELSELTMKFKRHLDCEIVDFQILSDDYSKLVFLRTDRFIEFHAKFGTYYKTRIPKVSFLVIMNPV
jgi:ribosome biogenesis protein ENP2